MNRQIREDFKENTSAMKQEAASLTKSSAESSAEREPAGGSAGRGRPRRNPRRILSDLRCPPNTKCVSPSLSHLWDSKEPMVSVKNANTRHGDITRDVPSYVHVSGNRFAYYDDATRDASKKTRTIHGHKHMVPMPWRCRPRLEDIQECHDTLGSISLCCPTRTIRHSILNETNCSQELPSKPNA